MIRKIIQIDQEKCNGCGACAAACHEGAIAMVEGKARLMRDDYNFNHGVPPYYNNSRTSRVSAQDTKLTAGHR